VKLIVRWESARPIREARRKTSNPLSIPLEEDHYAVAVYGIPKSLIDGDAAKSARQLRAEATLKCLGKNILKPSDVRILLPEGEPVVVYYFSKQVEITWRDGKVDFAAHIGGVKFEQSFLTGDMILKGKLEL
jgi:hypothetical protein